MICWFETAVGKMAVIFVGAEIVRSIITEWSGVVAPHAKREIHTINYENENINYAKGVQIGRFAMGSTIICLFEKNKIEFADNLHQEMAVKMGQKMAVVKEKKKKTTA